MTEEEMIVEEDEVKEEEPLGVLLYGFDGKESSYLQAFLTEVMEQYVLALSAAGQEENPVQGILSSPSKAFEEKEIKILMFLGFDDEKISKVLNEFPSDGSIHRPIFCGLTAENINWPLKQLIEHLQEEDKQWKDREASG
jgi:hypothetical protein